MRALTWMLLSASAAIGIGAAPASAAITLDFENIAPYPNNNDVLINGFYNGGTSSIGTSGPNLGVQFSAGARLLCLTTASAFCANTSRGGQGIATSQLGALFFPQVNPTINVAAGFSDGFSFVYSDPFTAGTTVNIFSGLDGTGTLLGSLILPGTPNAGCDIAIAQGAVFCPFSSASVPFSGTAQSVTFTGPVNRQVFDDLTFGSLAVGAVPEPSTWAMLLLGLGAVGVALRRGRRSARLPSVV